MKLLAPAGSFPHFWGWFCKGCACSFLLISFTAQAANNGRAIQAGEEGAARARSYGLQLPAPAPPKSASDFKGPYTSWIVRNLMLVDGLGSPPRGPVSLHIKNDKLHSIGAANAEFEGVEFELDGTGMYALPGFIDSHAHIGTPGQGLAGPITPPEYIFKLWLAHGITTVREVGSTMGLRWTVDHARRSAAGEITAPRIVPYAMFPGGQITTADGAKKWVRQVASAGAKGVKLRGGSKEAVAAVYATAQKLKLGTANHHDQTGVYHVNVLDSARAGLDSMEHWYGLPEALFENRTIQDYPPDYNYSDEQWRFGQAGRLWKQAAAPGSDHWNAVMQELVDLDFTLVPTFTIYEANRDVARAKDAIWHGRYTLPALAKFFLPDPRLHGSYHFDWTTAEEVAWRNNFSRWMRFVNGFKNSGGRVAAGSDAGFIFKLFGFAYIRELELLQEAGFHPLEVIQAATLNGAELLGMDESIGSISPGKQADFVLVRGNPVANFKLLYGTGHMQLNRETNSLQQVGGVSYTVKNGVLFDAKKLLQDVEDMVTAAKEKQAEAARSGK